MSIVDQKMELFFLISLFESFYFVQFHIIIQFEFEEQGEKETVVLIQAWYTIEDELKRMRERN